MRILHLARGIRHGYESSSARMGKRMRSEKGMPRRRSLVDYGLCGLHGRRFGQSIAAAIGVREGPIERRVDMRTALIDWTSKKREALEISSRINTRFIVNHG